MKTSPTLHTERLILRPFSLEDAGCNLISADASGKLTDENLTFRTHYTQKG